MLEILNNEILTEYNTQDVRTGYKFYGHPGNVIKKYIADRGMKQKELASLMNYSNTMINSVIRGKRDISIDVAISLETATGIEAAFWIGLQIDYEKELAR